MTGPTWPQLKHSPARILVQLLIDLGVGSRHVDQQVWPVFYSMLPDDPAISDNALAVFDTAGTLDGRLTHSGQSIDHPGWQVRARSTTSEDGYEKLVQVGNQFDAVYDVIVEIVGIPNGNQRRRTLYRIQNIKRTGTVIPIGNDAKDSKRRLHHTLNGILTVRLISDGEIDI